LPFTEAQIKADPEYQTVQIRGELKGGL
jgi:hypothetical protein